MLARSIVADRYALAFFNLAREKNLVDLVGQELAEAVNLFKSQADLQKLLAHPLVTKDDKKKVLEAIFAENHQYTKNLLYLLVDKGRLKEIEALLVSFRNLWAREENILKAEVVAARPLREDLEKALKAKLEKATGKTIDLEVTIDKKIIGGLTIRLGDYFIDGSIKRDLERLKEQLYKLQVGKVG